MKNSAVLLAAGESVRMGMGINKTLIEINGKPLLWYSLNVFEQCSLIDDVVLVTQRDVVDKVKCGIIDRYGFSKVKKIVTGGSERQYSVYNGLSALKDTYVVVVHDGARPLVTPDMLSKVIEAANEYGCSTVGVPLKDTVKILDENNLVTRTPDRKSMWAIQTPQAFKFELIKWAHEKARSEGTVATDDCALVENMGGDVKIVMGDYRNIKATTPEDLIVLKSFIGI